MPGIVTGAADIKYDRLSIVPLGGQSELGQVLWVISYGGELLLVDAGAAYPDVDLPGVDLLFPNTNFLEANKERISALLLTNGHEEHCGAVCYLLNHLQIPRIMAPRFVSSLILQALADRRHDTVIDTIETRHPYQIGPFVVEWIQVNDAIADACALQISTPEGVVVYTSSFKLDQTPVDGRLLDVAKLAQIGDSGVLLLLSDSAGVESQGYTPSEKAVVSSLRKHIQEAAGRVIVVLPGTNTYRLQLLFDLASKLKRKVCLCGESLIKTALVAVITGNLIYDRELEASQEDLVKLADQDVLVVATGLEGDPFDALHKLAYGKTKEIVVKEGDTVIFSAEVATGSSRQLAMILDQFLSFGVKVIYGVNSGVHVSKHASCEELKLMLSLVKPRYFIPALGEGRHIMHHAQLAQQCGLNADQIFALKNGQILEVGNGLASVIGELESEAVLYNRDQGERVTNFSVKERRTLSVEGVITIGFLVSPTFELLSAPIVEGGAAGFLKSDEWANVQVELKEAILNIVFSFAEEQKGDLSSLRGIVRDTATKMIRSRLQAKPMIQVVVHQLPTRLPV